jgi:cytochrome c553
MHDHMRYWLEQLSDDKLAEAADHYADSRAILMVQLCHQIQAERRRAARKQVAA